LAVVMIVLALLYMEGALRLNRTAQAAHERHPSQAPVTTLPESQAPIAHRITQAASDWPASHGSLGQHREH
ncbi:MAG: hypothetical protein ACKVVP_16510, partial [Chloroflexota bacterium]